MRRCMKQIADLAVARRLPTVFCAGAVDAGGLVSYGTNLREATRHMARYVDAQRPTRLLLRDAFWELSAIRATTSELRGAEAYRCCRWTCISGSFIHARSLNRNNGS